MQRVHIRLFLAGVYFSIYAVGMVGTAYGIYSLAFVRPFLATRVPGSLMDTRPLAVQANEKGVNTRIDLILAFHSVHAYTRYSSSDVSSMFPCVNQ